MKDIMSENGGTGDMRGPVTSVANIYLSHLLLLLMTISSAEDPHLIHSNNLAMKQITQHLATNLDETTKWFY